MAYNVKEVVANKPSRFTAGHRMCAGCGAPPIARHIMRALKPEDHAVVCRSYPDVWKFLLSFIPIPLGPVLLFILLLNVLVRP